MNPIESDYRNHEAAFEALIDGRHGDPFSLLGVHKSGKSRLVRTFQPYASRVEIVGSAGEDFGEMERVHPYGLFVAEMPPNKRRYLFRITHPDGNTELVEDAYRFTPTLGDMDLYLLGEGSDKQVYNKLGAQVREFSGVRGTRFAVWAPNASRVSVVGDFNQWDGRVHTMRLHPANGIWEIFVPGVGEGARYKFELLDQDGKLLPLKADPFGRYHEAPRG